MLLIDLDPCIYQCGFASEHVSYEVVYEKEDGSVMSKYYPDGGAMKAGKKELEEDGWKPIDQERIATPEPEAFAIQILNTKVRNIIEAVEKSEGPMSRAMYLTGKGNFRERIATVKPYKGNRANTPKPIHYDLLREYMIDKGAILVEGWEADDQVSIDSRAYFSPVIATIDKDLDQIPGRHYDYLKKTFYTVDEEEAMWMFYRQILSGDNVDNIPGLPRVGMKTAQKWLEEWHKEWEVFPDPDYNVSLEEYWWNYIVEKYDAAYEEDEGYDIAVEMARLVKMQDYEGQLWRPPGEEDDRLDDIA